MSYANRRQQAPKQTSQQANNDDPFNPQKEYSDYRPVSEGKHIVQVTAATLKDSKAGNPMLVLRLRVVSPGDSLKLSFTEWIVLKPGYGYRILSRVCKAINPKMESIQQDPQMGIDVKSQKSVHDHMLGAVFGTETRHEESEYKGEPSVRVRLGRCWYLEDNEWALLQNEYDKGNGEIAPDLPADAEFYPYDSPLHSPHDIPSQDDEIPF